MDSKTVFLAFVFLLTYFTASAVGQTVTVSIPELTTAEGTFGEKVPVNVTELNEFNLISANLTVGYDINVLTATGVTVADTIAEGSMVVHDIDDENGTINVAISRSNPFNDSGTLVFIFFDVDSDNINDSSILELSQVKLNSGAISAITSDGLITIVEPPPPATVTLSIQKDIITSPGVTGVQVPVNVTDVTDLGIISANLIIGYDTSVLTATGATVLGTIAQDADMEVDIDDAKGKILLGLMRDEPLSGSGVLVFIVFDVDSDDPSEHSALTFQQAHINGGALTTRVLSGEVSLPVTLSNFVAVTSLSGDEVVLKWRVESETDNIGFAIYRSEQKDGPYTKVGYVNSKGDTLFPRQYRFIDDTTERGKIYFYMLESISITGETERSDPVKFDWSMKYQTITTWGKLKL